MYSVRFMLPDNTIGALTKDSRLVLFDTEEVAWNIAHDLFQMKTPPKFVWVRREETTSTSL